MIDRSKLDRVLTSIEVDHGPFVLAGLFKREDSPGRWDLVVSAPWLQRGKLVALGDFVKRLSDAFGQDEVPSRSRIVTLNRRDAALKRILQELGSITKPVEKIGHNLFGLPREHAYVFRAHGRTPSNKRITDGAPGAPRLIRGVRRQCNENALIARRPSGLEANFPTIGGKSRYTYERPATER